MSGADFAQGNVPTGQVADYTLTSVHVRRGLGRQNERCAALVIATVEGGMLRARLARDADQLQSLVPLLQELVTRSAGARSTK